MRETANVENFRKYKNEFTLVVEMIPPFDSSSNMVREVKKFKEIASKRFTLLNILIGIYLFYR